MQIHKYKSYFGWDGDNGTGEMLIKQIIDGTKTATCSFKILYTQEELKEVYETEGRLVTVMDANNRPRCNIRIMEVFETTFGNPDLRLVRGEGDGGNTGKFKQDHKRAWESTVPGIPLSDDAVLIAELFELAEVSSD